MKKDRILNDCTNCAYFVRHYANLHGKYYLVSGCQHCRNTELTLSEQKKRLNNREICQHWLPRQVQIQKRRESIEAALPDMCNYLEDIAQILKDDNK